MSTYTTGPVSIPDAVSSGVHKGIESLTQYAIMGSIAIMIAAAVVPDKLFGRILKKVSP